MRFSVQNDFLKSNVFLGAKNQKFEHLMNETIKDLNKISFPIMQI